MTDPQALIAVLQRWQEAVAQGREPTPEELCPQQPELHRALWLALAALRGVHEVDPDAVTFEDRPEAVGTVIYRGDSKPDLKPPVLAPAGFEILGELGRTGTSIVYRARHVALNREVALKLLLDGDCARFEHEAQVLARLQHPNILPLYEVGGGGPEGRPHLCVGLCPGGTLAARLARQSLPPREAAELVRTLAGAVQHVHERGYLLSDLAPEGILLTADGQPVLSNFGLAQPLSDPVPAPVLGTPSYTPPEQVNASMLGPACDVYGLGAILYACLTGRPPFQGATATATLLLVTGSEPTPLRELAPAIPADLATICHACMCKDPSQRYPTAQALAQDLDNYLAGRPSTRRPRGWLGWLRGLVSGS